MGTVLLSFETATSFLDKCQKECQKVRGDLRTIGSIEVAGQSDSWKRVKLFNHLSFSTLFFEQRIEFFLACMKYEDINIDILESLFRGLIEIYSRVLFITNSTDDEAAKKIIWQDLYLVGLSGLDFIKDPSVRGTVAIDYQILKSIGAEMPPIEIIQKYVQAKLWGRGFNKDIKKIVDSYRFPGVREILSKYYEEKDIPIIPRYFLYKSYSELSEQLHGNYLMERVDPDHSGKYRVVAFLILLALKFLKAVSKKTNSEREIDPLIEEFERFRADYLKLWRPFQLS
jgi:hypothetical protein